MTVPGEELNLSNLPPDVIQKILDVDSANAMRLISPLWIEHLTQRKTIPHVDRIHIHKDLMDQKTVLISMENKYQRYLEAMQYRVSIPTENLIELSHRYSSDSTVFEGKLRADLAGVFGRCPNIQRLELSLGRIDQTFRKEELLEIVKLLRMGSVENLVFTGFDYFCEETAKSALAAIEGHHFSRLILTSNNVHSFDTAFSSSLNAEFFSTALRFVPEVAIELTDQSPDYSMASYWAAEIDSRFKIDIEEDTQPNGRETFRIVVAELISD